MRTRLRSKVTLLFVVVAALIAIPAIALADNVQNDVVATAGQKIVTIEAGQTSNSIGYVINATGGDSTDTTGRDGQSCNPAVTPANVTFSGLPTGATAADSVVVKDATTGNTLSAPQLTFTGCDTYQYVKFAVGSSVTPGDYTISVADITNGSFLSGDFNESPASFTLHVTAPSDTAVPTNASILIDNGATWTNNSLGTVSLALSASDNVGVAKYYLAETQAGLSSASAVTVSPAEASFSRSNVSFTLTGIEGASKAVWLRVCDAQNNCSDASDAIGWDKTAPVITDDSANNPPTGTAGSNGWYTSAVTNTFKASDGLSGFLNQTDPYTFTKSSGTAEGSAVKINSGSVSDQAGNPATAVDSAAFKIDLTRPDIPTFNNIQAQTYAVADLPAQNDVTCSSSDAISQLASCVVTGYSSAFGSHTLTATATDNAGWTRTAQLTYIVGEQSGGILSPVYSSSNPLATNLDSFKIKSVIPVKFQLFNDAAKTQLMTSPPAGSVAKISFFKYDSSTETDQAAELLSAGTANTDGKFRWDGTNYQYIYNLATSGKTAGTYGVQLTLYESDLQGATVLAQSDKQYFVLR